MKPNPFAVAGAVRLAGSLLALADDAGLSHLQARCLDFIVHNFSAVVSTSATADKWTRPELMLMPCCP